ncbi:MAG: hypothetical protein AAB483_02780 [Patescibacteria group bacterium]
MATLTDSSKRKLDSLERGEGFVSIRMDQGTLANQLAEMSEAELRGVLRKLRNTTDGFKGFHGKLNTSLTKLLEHE